MAHVLFLMFTGWRWRRGRFQSRRWGWWGWGYRWGGGRSRRRYVFTYQDIIREDHRNMRSQNSYTVPCKPCGSNWRFSDFCRPHTARRKQIQAKCIHDLPLLCVAFHTYLSSHSDRSAYTCKFNESWLLWSQEKAQIGTPCQANGTGSGIYSLILWRRQQSSPAFKIAVVHSPETTKTCSGQHKRMIWLSDGQPKIKSRKLLFEHSLIKPE